MSESTYKEHVSNVALVTPEGCIASIQPVVLWRTVSVYLLIALIPTEPDPEVSIWCFQVMDEGLYLSLLILRLNTDKISTITPAGSTRIFKVEFTPSVLKIGDFIAGLLSARLAYLLALRDTL